MKYLIYILLTLSIAMPLLVSAQNPFRGDTIDCSDIVALSWVKTAGDIDDDAATGISVDGDGNIIIAGYFRGDMVFQTQTVTSVGGSDIFVAKLDADGNLIWLETEGGTQDDYASGVAVDGNNDIIVLGSYRGTATIGSFTQNSVGGKDLFLAKYSSAGVFDWAKFPGGFNDDLPGNVTVDNNNNILITATYNFAMGIGTGSIVSKGVNDFLAAKYSSDGTFLWSTHEGSTLDDYGVAISTDASGNAYITGEFAGTLNFGSSTITASGAKDVFLAKYNSSGVFQWAKKFGTGGDNDKAGNVATDINGNTYVFYKSDQVADMARIDKFSSAGTPILNIGFGGTGIVTAKGITVDATENIYVSGMYSGLTDFGDGDVNIVGGSDYFIAKFKADGSFNFKDNAGSIYIDCGNSICLDQNNNIIVGGYCNNGMYFGSTPYPAQGKEDVMVVKYDRFFSFGDIMVSSINCDPNNMCVDITVLGGTPDLTYYWDNNPVTSLDFCGISTGDHQVIVTDETTPNHCFIETTITIQAPIVPNITLPSNMNACPFDTVTLDAGAGNYSWVWSTLETTQTIEVSDVGTYSVTATDLDNGCSATESLVLTKFPNINLLVDDQAYVCEGDEISFSVEGFMQYLWSDFSTNSTYTTDDDGFHWVRVYNGICYYYDTILVINYIKPELDLGADRIICRGDSIELVAPAGFTNYLWQDNSTNQNYWASEEGIVSISVIDNNGCEATDAISLSLQEKPYVWLGEDTTYCSDVSIILYPNDQSDDNTYLWSNSSTGNNLAVSSTGNYWVEVTNLVNCSSYDTVNIIIYPEAQVELGPNVEFCNGGSSEIFANGSFISWQWSDLSTDVSVIATETGMFSVTVTDANLCIATDTVFIFEHEIFDPFLGYDTTLCTSDIYTLGPTHEYQNYLWSDSSKGPSIEIIGPGTYSLTVTDDIGCSATSSIDIVFADGPIITSVASGGGDIVINATGGTPPLIYSYDGDTWLESNVISGLPSDTYTISVMDENYCMVTIETFLDQTIDVPSFFTPNGDGYNDYWVISGLYHFPSAEIQIYDRFGKKLYEFIGTEFGWNGQYMGAPLPSDTYWYAIRLVDGRQPLTGNVTLKR